LFRITGHDIFVQWRSFTGPFSVPKRDIETIEKAFAEAAQHSLRWDVAMDAISAAAGGRGGPIAHALAFSAASATVEAFELSGMAAVLLNRSGEALALNQQAENLLGAGIRIVNKRLVAERPEATQALDRALHVLIRGDKVSALAPPVTLPRAGRLPLMAYPLRLSNTATSITVRCLWWWPISNGAHVRLRMPCVRPSP
jgi:hypothetical protein